MSDQDHPAWPTADDDVPPERPEFPTVDPDASRPPGQTRPIQRPELPRAVPMRIEPSGKRVEAAQIEPLGKRPEQRASQADQATVRAQLPVMRVESPPAKAESSVSEAQPRRVEPERWPWSEAQSRSAGPQPSVNETRPRRGEPPKRLWREAQPPRDDSASQTQRVEPLVRRTDSQPLPGAPQPPPAESQLTRREDQAPSGGRQSSRFEPQPPPSPPSPPSDSAEPQPPKRRRKTLIIVGAIVLVIAVGGGVVLAVPGGKEKLGFGEPEPEVTVQPPPAPIAFTPSLKGPSAEAPVPSAQGVQNALAGPAGVSALGNLTGTVLDAATGTVLWDKGASTALVPASTAKVLTAAAALLKIDRGQQFSTRVVAGKDPGTVVLVGGGDSTLSSLPAGKESVYPGAAHLDDLVAQVKASAGGKVTQVFVDRSRYTGDDLAPGWLPGDVAEGYIAPITPAMMDGGRADPTKDKSPRSPNPPRALATEFAKRLGATLAAKPEVTAPADAKVLGEVKSAPLTELVDNFLQASDNVLAETVSREVAKAAGEEASFTGVSKATLKILQENGFDVAGAALTDGSGLSTNDRVSARLLASVLAVAAGPDGKDPRTAKLRPLLGGLPVAGGSGTLAGRFAPGLPSASGRGWVRAKTGTLSGVNSLAGIVLDADGRLLVFALMTSGTDANAARPALDAVAAALRACGCK